MFVSFERDDRNNARMNKESKNLLVKERTDQRIDKFKKERFNERTNQQIYEKSD